LRLLNGTLYLRLVPGFRLKKPIEESVSVKVGFEIFGPDGKILAVAVNKPANTSADEANFIRSLNRFKLLGLCSTVPNNSFFCAMPSPPASTFKQKGGHCDEATLTVEPKVYVVLTVNEGDTLKTANGLMGDGAWSPS